MSYIELYDIDKYKEYLEYQFPSFKRHWWWFSGKKVTLKAKVFEIPISLSGSALENLFIEQKLQYAAREWLPPETELRDLIQIQDQSGLGHIDDKLFAKEIANVCKYWIQKHPKIEKWIWKKITLLEFIYSPPAALSNQLLQVSLGLRIIQRDIIFGELGEDPYEEAERALQQALEAACNFTSEILNSEQEECELWSNLMVPFDSKDEYLEEIEAEQESLEMKNWSVADHLWTSCNHTGKVLGIVAEPLNREEKYKGFWVPLIYTPRSNTPLPGAPHAYSRKTVHAIFRDDLPLHLFDEFSAELCEQWKAYFLNEFGGDVFVSIPFFLPRSSNRDREPKVYAILNINARVPDKKAWRRACHKEWLKVVRDRVAPLVCEAYLAYKLRNDIFVVEVLYDE